MKRSIFISLCLVFVMLFGTMTMFGERSEQSIRTHTENISQDNTSSYSYSSYDPNAGYDEVSNVISIILGRNNQCAKINTHGNIYRLITNVGLYHPFRCHYNNTYTQLILCMRDRCISHSFHNLDYLKQRKLII